MFPACWHTNSSMVMLIKGFHMLSKESYKQTDKIIGTRGNIHSKFN